MASGTAQRIALVPIKPKFALAIFNGSKRVEFRKTGFTSTATHIVVYASSPVQQILGYFLVKGFDSGDPKELWLRYRSQAEIGYDEFSLYYSRSQKAVAILVGSVHRLKEPLNLSDLDPHLKPPQNYRYITAKTFETIKAYT